MASTTDLFTYVGSPGTATTLAAPGYTAGVSTSINVGSTTNWPSSSDSKVFFAIDRAQVVDGTEERIAGTYCEFEGIVADATTISDVSKTYGNAQDYPAGSLTRVYIPVSSSRENALVEGLEVEHNLDGTHSDITADSVESPVINDITFADVGWYKGYQLFTSGGTWNKPTGLKFVIVEATGGGGGGGGVGTTSGAGSGGGGASGTYSMKKILAASLGSTETVTIPAAAAGGVGNNTGSTGGTVSFGAHVTAPGGVGGQGTVGNTGGNAGAMGSAGTGDVSIPGAHGFQGTVDTTDHRGGNGGGVGAGVGEGANGNGNAGAANSGGGGAGGRDSGTTSRNGGAGGTGLVIVHEYF